MTGQPVALPFVLNPFATMHTLALAAFLIVPVQVEEPAENPGTQQACWHRIMLVVRALEANQVRCTSRQLSCTLSDHTPRVN